MESFGSFSRAELAAGAALIAYVENSGSEAPADRAAEAARRQRDDADRRGHPGQPRTVCFELRCADRHALRRGQQNQERGRITAPRRAAGEPALPIRTRSISVSTGCNSFVDRGRFAAACATRSPPCLTCCARSRVLASTAAARRDLDLIRAGLQAAEAIAGMLDLDADESSGPAAVSPPFVLENSRCCSR